MAAGRWPGCGPVSTCSPTSRPAWPKRPIASAREIGAAEQAELPLVEALDGAEQYRAEAEAALAEAEAAHRSCESDHHAWLARVDALALALDEARSRAGAERLADVDGVLGTLLDLVEVDAGWEAAFEAAAGEALAAVVVDGVDAARRALETLHREAISGAVLALVAGGVGRSAPPVGRAPSPPRAGERAPASTACSTRWWARPWWSTGRGRRRSTPPWPTPTPWW